MALSCEDVSLGYEGKPVVEHLNFRLEQGDYLCILGENGSGKSTLMKAILGLKSPMQGMLVRGEDLKANEIGYLPQQTVTQRDFPASVQEIVLSGFLSKRGMRPFYNKEERKIAQKNMKRLEIEPFMKKCYRDLSGGQQQRIAIARALVNEPQILLLDEPLGALDLKMRKEMQLELKSMHERLGITFIYVTHDQEEALTMSDKIVVMSEGRMQQIGTPEDIYNEPKNAFVADFIGESNIFTGIMTDKLKVRFCGAEFACVDDVEHGRLVEVVVRPEDVEITTPENGAITGTVTSVVFKGVHYEITVESGKNEIVIQSTKTAAVGSQVGLNVEPDGIHIMIPEHTLNKIESDVDKNYELTIFDGKIQCDLTKIIPGSKFNDAHELLDAHGDVIDYEKLKVVLAIKPRHISMSDNEEEGIVCGHIINLIYKGDHYSYVVRTDMDEDFIVNDEYLWNMDDYVSLVIPEEHIQFSIKK